MATYKHPLTGVHLNVVSLDRETVDEIEAVTIHIMHKQFEDQDMIAHKLGVNQGRVNEVLKGHRFPKSAEKAAQLLRANGDTLI